MDWPQPFAPIEHEADRQAFVAELQRELKAGHPLFGVSVRAIGRRYDQDDVLFEFHDGTGRVAEVHLTWVGVNEQPPWPGTL